MSGLIFLLTWLCGSAAGLGAEPLDQWYQLQVPSRRLTNDVYDYPRLNAVTCSGSTFVAVGSTGTILTSSDATNWTSRLSGTAYDLYSVTCGNGIYVAVGGAVETGGEATILTSVDGVVWTPQRSGTSPFLFGAAYGNGTFVAVGYDTVLTSSNGVQWTLHSLPDIAGLNGVAYGNGQFVAVGYTTLDCPVLTSVDGNEWTAGMKIPAFLAGCAYGRGQFIAVGGGLNGEDQGCLLRLSADATTWADQSSGVTNFLRSVAYAGGTFVAVGDRGMVLTSTDGLSWIEHNPCYHDLFGVSYGNGRFVAVGAAGTILLSEPISQPSFPLRIATTASGATGPLELSVTGPAGQVCFIEVSSSLLEWLPLAELVMTNGTARFTDHSVADFRQRFYRAALR